MYNATDIAEKFIESRAELFYKGLKEYTGLTLARKYTHLMDRFVSALFSFQGRKRSSKKSGTDVFALLALGSYGRRELCLNSDVDLMIVHQGRLGSEMERVISSTLYPLWDSKIEVGHSIVSVQECIHLAFQDFRVLTSLMDCRFILGSGSFFRLFEEALYSRISREGKKILTQFLILQQDRADRSNREGAFLEPDIKEGLGGLRDLHTMTWMSRAFFKCKKISQMKKYEAFAHFEFNRLSRSRGFLIRLRNHLHALTKRKEDHLLLPFQQKIPLLLGYKDRSGISAEESFMKELYLHMNRIRYGYEQFQVKTLDIISPFPPSRHKGLIPSEEFEIIKGNLVLAKGSLKEKDPGVILRALNEADRLGLYLGSGFIWEAEKILSQRGKELKSSKEMGALFLGFMLRPPDFDLLRLSLEIGLISLFIPEFKKIRNLPQFGVYHVETVDLHSLRTLHILKKISLSDGKWPQLKQIFDSLKDPEQLFLACVLHDIGKGYGSDHCQKGSELIARILKRFKIGDRTIETVKFLVLNHVFLAHISQRRDLNDEKTAVNVAQTAGDKDTLAMLLLLTVADSFATGPLARSDWKILLMIELYRKAENILEKGMLASPDATKKIRQKRASALETVKDLFPAKEISKLMEGIPAGYLLNTDPGDIEDHLMMALDMGKDIHKWRFKKIEDTGITRILQCIRDRPGFFSKMVGVLTLHNIKVITSQIYTLKNGLAFDIYEVTDPSDPVYNEEKWRRIREQIILALEEDLPLDEMIKRKGKMTLSKEGYSRKKGKRVTVSNRISDFFTIIEVWAEPRLGLLYELGKSISYLGLDIRFARFNSDEEQVTGVFYVRDRYGQKIEEREKLHRIREDIGSLIA